MDQKKATYIKIPIGGVIFFSVLLAATSFYSGKFFFGGSKSVNTNTSNTQAKNKFEATKSNKPELKFFVMSFCPYGNQMEDILKPIVDLLGDKADIRPQYIFDKVENLSESCKARSGDPTKCDLYVKNEYFKSVDECKKAVTANLEKCMDEKSYIKASNGTLYGSLHGRVEANQNVREICAFNLTDNKKSWWNFVDNVNKNCNSQNADTCWEDQAKKAGLDTNKITECFNKDGINLIEKEITETTKYKVSGSPTVLINGVQFPPESAYAQDGKGSLAIGNKVITQDQFRTPNTLKEAICASFGKAPKECNTTLAANTTTGNAQAGGCGQ